MTMNTASNSIFEIEWRKNMVKKAFKHFDEDGDGKLSAAELVTCLRSCYGIRVDDNEIKKFFQFDEEYNKIDISEILRVFDSKEDNFFQNLKKMDSFDLSIPLLNLIFKNMQKPEEVDHIVIDINQLNILLPPDSDEYSNISKLRDLFLGITGQAAISLIAYTPSHQQQILVAANALAFLLLLLSFLLRGKKPVAADRIMGSISILTAVVVFFLMMGMISIPVKMM